MKNLYTGLLLGATLLLLPTLGFAHEGHDHSATTSDAKVCTMQYAPVCGARQVQCIKAPCYPVYETFGNRCMLDSANQPVTFIHEGECTANETGPVKTPLPAQTYTPPQNCQAWFDGCNSCTRSTSGASICTKKACSVEHTKPGYCTAYVSEVPQNSTSTATTTPSTPVTQSFWQRIWQSFFGWLKF